MDEVVKHGGFPNVGGLARQEDFAEAVSAKSAQHNRQGAAAGGYSELACQTHRRRIILSSRADEKVCFADLLWSRFHGFLADIKGRCLCNGSGARFREKI